jgi:hypothetical protein
LIVTWTVVVAVAAAVELLEELEAAAVADASIVTWTLAASDGAASG